MAKVSQAAKIGLFAVITAGAGYLVWGTIHRSTGKGGGYVFNTIHNIQAQVPVENLMTMVDTIKELRGASSSKETTGRAKS